MLIIIFSSQTSMLSIDGLHKAIVPSQLTRDLDGTLPYDHAKWIEICLVILF